ncbi:hypothetical protein PoB_006106700 [Plakobranchus ocellatus]|uniref:Uncharacterized protein n=1 Tax=Plakobranchus ocellatus TaxID=259542 RepID=A0AAV4CRQ1_9GAST|nr:hypothetical protein PoB_006106700 [Plakobranchus ocellatus]
MKRSGGSSGRAVGYQVTGPRCEFQSRPSQFFSAPLCPPSTKWVARSFKTGESKGGGESNGKLPHNAVCQEHSRPFSWFPDAWSKRTQGVSMNFTSLFHIPSCPQALVWHVPMLSSSNIVFRGEASHWLTDER